MALTPQVLLERLCAPVPRPRRHLVTYHGVFAPAASQRDLVVPGSPKSAAFGRRGCRGESGGGGTSGDAGGGQESWPDLEPTPLRVVPHAQGKRRRGGRYYRWAEPLRRVFWAEVMVCPHCGADRRLLAAIHDPTAIREILIGMGLSPEPPARSPPRSDGVEGGRLWSG
ncbi:MAG: hypothetical protein IPK26_09330 [Planctomycetes bacterium]|nr:hypothetical protein [Planctomycetota bacterium]